MHCYKKIVKLGIFFIQRVIKEQEEEIKMLKMELAMQNSMVSRNCYRSTSL